MATKFVKVTSKHDRVCNYCNTRDENHEFYDLSSDRNNTMIMRICEVCTKQLVIEMGRAVYPHVFELIRVLMQLPSDVHQDFIDSWSEDIVRADY